MDVKKLLLVMFLFSLSFALNHTFSVSEVYPSWAVVNGELYNVHIAGDYSATYFDKVSQVYPTYVMAQSGNCSGLLFPLYSSGNYLMVQDYFNGKVGRIDFSTYPSLSLEYTTNDVRSGLPYKLLDLKDGNHIVTLKYGSSYWLLLMNSTGSVLSSFQLNGLSNVVHYNDEVFVIVTNDTGMFVTKYDYSGSSLSYSSSYMVDPTLFPANNSDYKYLSRDVVGYNDWIILLNQNEDRDSTLLVTFNLTSGTPIDFYETNITYAYSSSARSILHNTYDNNLYAMLYVNTKLIFSKINESGHFLSVKTGSLYPAVSPYVPIDPTVLPYSGLISEPIQLNESSMYWILQVPVADRNIANDLIYLSDLFAYGYNYYDFGFTFQYFLVSFNGTDIKYEKLGSYPEPVVLSYPNIATLSVFQQDHVVLVPVLGITSQGTVRKTAVVYIDSLIENTSSEYSKIVNCNTHKEFRSEIGSSPLTGEAIEPERLIYGTSADVLVYSGSCDNVSAVAGPVLSNKVVSKNFYWVFNRNYLYNGPQYSEAVGSPVESSLWNDTYHNETREAYQVNYTGPASDYTFVVTVCGSHDCRMVPLQSGTEKCVAEPKISSSDYYVYEGNNVTFDAWVGEVGYPEYLMEFTAGLYVDGNFVKNVTFSDHTVSLDLASGNHTVELVSYSLPDLYTAYQSRVFNITVTILSNFGVSGGGGFSYPSQTAEARINIPFSHVLKGYRMEIVKGLRTVYSGDVKPLELAPGRYRIVIYDDEGKVVFEEDKYLFGNYTISLPTQPTEEAPTQVTHQVSNSGLVPLSGVVAVILLLFLLVRLG